MNTETKPGDVVAIQATVTLEPSATGEVHLWATIKGTKSLSSLRLCDKCSNAEVPFGDTSRRIDDVTVAPWISPEKISVLETLLREVLSDPTSVISHAFAPYKLKPGEVETEWTPDIDTDKPHHSRCWRCRAEAALGEKVSDDLELYMERMRADLLARNTKEEVKE